MKKTILAILLCGCMILGLTGCNKTSEDSSETGTKSDRISGSNYEVYGIEFSVPDQYANRWVINNLNVKFMSGVYSVSYCIDDIYTTTSCDISKHSGKGNYTIAGDNLYLNITESTVTDVVLDETETKNINTKRTCQIIEGEQIIIDCSEDGGWIYFSQYKDDNYLTKADCMEFNGKTYSGDAYVNGYYLRNGTWVSDPTTFTKEFSFENGKLVDTVDGIFENLSCEKINETTYKLGSRTAIYDAENDTFTITINTVNGIDYGTMKFIEKSKKPKAVSYPEISNSYLCDKNDKCTLQTTVTLADMKKFAKDNGLTMKIIYDLWDSNYPNGKVVGYCEPRFAVNGYCHIVKMEGKKATEGDTFYIGVEKH